MASMEKKLTFGLDEIIGRLRIESLMQHWQRAVENIETHPAHAITAARCLVESVCKVVLETRGEEPLRNVYQKALDCLNLEPIHDQVAKLTGELRRHYGDAHGQGGRVMQVEPRHARFAVCLAGGFAAFLLETLELQPYWDVLCVCQGATCRSPMAAAIIQDLFEKKGRRLIVAAAGLGLDPRGVMPEALGAVPGAAGIKRVLANRLTLNSARLVITMDEKQNHICRQHLENLDPDRVVLMGELAGRGIERFPDPYDERTGEQEHDNQVYQDCANKLREWLVDGMPEIEARLRPRVGD